MAKQLFSHAPDQCNPILPHDPVMNRVTFMEVALFEIPIPLDIKFPKNPFTKESYIPGWLQNGPGQARFGLPVSDVWPELFPEAPSILFKSGGKTFRLGMNGMVVPAVKENLQYSSGTTVPVNFLKGRWDKNPILSKYANLVSSLTKGELHNLQAGVPITKLHDGGLVRLVNSRSMAELYPAVLPDSSEVTFTDMIGRHSKSSGDLDALQTYAEKIAESVARARERVAEKEHQAHLHAQNQKGASNTKYPTYEIGLLNSYEQVWTLDGYSRGGLVSSFTLAPSEEITIEVFSWDRSKVETTHDSSIEHEQNVEASSLTKVATQVARQFAENTDRSAGFGGGVTLPVKGVPVNIKANADVSNSLQEGMQTTIDSVSEATSRASERFKSSNQVKVVQTRETGREERVTRRIKNPNLGRTLTMNCFEVIEHYSVKTQLAARAPQFVLLVDFPRPTGFDILFVLAYQDKLERALLSTSYKEGFAAAKMLEAQRYFDNRSLAKAEIDAAQAKARAEQLAQSSGDAPKPPIVTVAKSIKKIIKKLKDLDLIKEVAVLAESYKLFGEKVSDGERADAHDALGRFNFWLKFRMVNPGIESKALEFIKALPDKPTPNEAYEALVVFVPGLDDEWLTTVKMVAANLVCVQLASTLLIPFPWLAPVLLEFAIFHSDMGLPGLIEKAKKEVRNFEMTLSMPPPPMPPAAGATPTGTSGFPPDLAPPQLYSLAQLSEADAEFKALQAHLEANTVYYMNYILAKEDVNIRYERLRALGIHNFVESRLLGFIGRRAIFPLHLTSLEDETRDYLEDKLLKKWKGKDGKLQVPKIDPKDQSVSLPTGGLYMEASLGSCDALEPYLQERRLLDLQTRRAGALRAEAEAQQQIEEAHRLAARLAQTPPLLDSPFGFAPLQSGDSANNALDFIDDSGTTTDG